MCVVNLSNMDTHSYYQWLYGTDLDSSLRYESRQLQLIGLVSILLVLYIPSQERFMPIEFLFLLLIILLELLLLIIYLYFSWPRRVKNSFPISRDDINDTNFYKEGILELRDTLKSKAKVMKISYVLFSLNVFSLFILFLLGLI